MKTLGVIGGAGPMATAYFMQQVIGLTDAATDQEHIRILVDNNPLIPDRTSYILDNTKDNPEPVFVEMGEKLVAAGAEVLAIPCITASYFIPRIEERLGVKVVDTLAETAATLSEMGIDAVGLMATDGTIKTGIFQKILERSGIRVFLPDEENQAIVMEAIYDCVKAGKRVDVNKLYHVKDSLVRQGAKLCILGCTELSVAAMDMAPSFDMDHGFIDAMEILAKSSIAECGCKVK